MEKQGKFYYLGNIINNNFHAGNKARKDCEIIFKKLNIEEIKMNYLAINKFYDTLIYKCIDQSAAIISNLKFLFKRNLLFFSQFPVEKKWGDFYFYNLKNIKIVSIVHDLDGLREKDENLLRKEIKNLKKSKYIISHNEKMTNFLIEKGIDKNKIKNLEIFDYILDKNNREINLKKSSDICFAGNLEKSLFIYKLKKIKNVKIDIFGINYQEEKNQGDFNYCGAYPPDEIHKKLSGRYGLIWDGDSLKECNGLYGEYLKYNNPHKFSLYVAAGIPVVTWKKAAIAEFIDKENLGITVNSLYDLEKVLLNLTNEEYEEKVKNILKLRKKIINGEMLTKLIQEILEEENNE